MNPMRKLQQSIREQRGVVFAVASWILAWPMLAPTAAGRELIENGSFEDDSLLPSPYRAGWDDAPGVGNDVGFGLFQHTFVSGGELQVGGGFELPPGAYDPEFTGEILPFGGGAVYGARWGWWNGDGRMGSATQVVDLRADSGSAFEFSAWLASRDVSDDMDYATVALEFFDEANSSGVSLGGLIFDGNDQTSQFIFGSLNLDGAADPMIAPTQDNWTLYRAEGRIPQRALSASVVIRGQVPEGVVENGVDAFVDLVSLQVASEPLDVPGDYNANGKVEQADLDLVLQNWGSDTIVAPGGWIRDFPIGPVDQAELDAVLLNWGNTQPPVNGTGSIPEPATMGLVLAVLPFVVAIRRTRARRSVS